ncbi:MAG: peroxidase [Planctomycetota bacterium]
MAYIKLIPPDQPTPDIEPLYSGAKQRAGGVANIIQVMSNDAPSASASMNFYVSLMKRTNGLSGAQREMLATVVSNANNCFY